MVLSCKDPAEALHPEVPSLLCALTLNRSNRGSCCMHSPTFFSAVCLGVCVCVCVCKAPGFCFCGALCPFQLQCLPTVESIWLPCLGPSLVFGLHIPGASRPWEANSLGSFLGMRTKKNLPSAGFLIPEPVHFLIPLRSVSGFVRGGWAHGRADSAVDVSAAHQQAAPRAD